MNSLLQTLFFTNQLRRVRTEASSFPKTPRNGAVRCD